MRGMKWYMRVLLAVAFALLFVGAGMTAVQAKGGDGGGITPQWWDCWPEFCLWTPCGDPPYGIEVLEICYAEGRGYWYRVECYDECPLRR